MFDIGFAELLVIIVLGLLILGPERLPVALKTMALWSGRFKRSYQQIRSDIEKEIGVDEIRHQLHNEDILQSIKTTQSNLEQFVNETEQSLTPVKKDIDKESTTNQLNPA
ncbi:MAG: twin-arginine translocase subunit TatB [Pseudomonadales bacterium]|nr:twin-arginine translocase subunit TatB [Pseudomonadales bacterium]